MSHLKFKSIEVEETGKRLVDPLTFKIQLACAEEIKSGVEFTVLYNMDVHSDKNDQVLSEIEVAPIPKGKVEFTIEADAPNVDLIPLNKLFGLTSILIVGKYKGQQFVRIGYIVDVSYPGIPSSLLENNEQGDDSEEITEEEDVDEEDIDEDEDDIEDEGDEDEDGSEDLEDSEGDKKTEETKTLIEEAEQRAIDGNKRLYGSEGEAEEMEEAVGSDSYSEINRELNMSVGEHSKKSNGECSDVFEYCGYSIDKKLIEMKLMIPPVISSFEINWEDDAGVDDYQDDESDKEHISKKHKVE
ncbi:histone chaperone [Ordospora colligata]|uniref:Anti-silencing function protein 1 n=1 Tax=Ordospora colligata OC4 TaxID=1354746 RepID=A0A0B2UJ96_9MICR|nr:gene silencing histone chaperone [Ordospora colligata OC4]KHN69274.1 gene silencing histone chaperone [Ordospora colligata OC4]TBU15090.1 histone chaperone [Ordospora colligata]TBU15141.1 histone chaperone [Ordospora colligata]TBU18387.1 histone chaperone [Ordospora colligata]